ncbi:unnamed protein product [Nippostrongylus brasiliensis]|uniref:Transthyretin-like family protein n=1 Tax=Nippostrongylus brasiliensis TaxID=27835 RepID=A0A0N4Y903_NIPBR|nr:unnamed protein product [Nippostrongylus brasiliensis]
MLIGLLGVLLTLQASISKSITGTLMCNGKPYAGAEVQLQGEDVTFLTYNLSALTTSDESGKYEVNYDNVLDYDMWLGFHHKCNYDGKCVLSRTYRFAKDELSGKDSYSLVTMELADKEKGAEVCDGKLVV